jgi:hypothetical protein
MEGEDDAYVVLVWKPEGNTPLARRRRSWAISIERDLKELG